MVRSEMSDKNQRVKGSAVGAIITVVTTSTVLAQKLEEPLYFYVYHRIHPLPQRFLQFSLQHRSPIPPHNDCTLRT